MKLNVSKEWCMKMADLEGDAIIGADVPGLDETAGYGSYARPTFRQRLWRRLGFGFHFDEALFDWRNQEAEASDWFVSSAFNTVTDIHIDWLDRLRILISGRCSLSAYTRTDVLVNKAESRSQFAVLPPG